MVKKASVKPSTQAEDKTKGKVNPITKESNNLLVINTQSYPVSDKDLCYDEPVPTPGKDWGKELQAARADIKRLEDEDKAKQATIKRLREVAADLEEKLKVQKRSRDEDKKAFDKTIKKASDKYAADLTEFASDYQQALKEQGTLAIKLAKKVAIVTKELFAHQEETITRLELLGESNRKAHSVIKHENAHYHCYYPYQWTSEEDLATLKTAKHPEKSDYYKVTVAGPLLAAGSIY